MRRIIGSILIAILSLAAAAQAQPVVSLTHYYVAKNGTQTVILNVTDGGSPAAEDIEGMIFSLQIASGTDSAPSIGAIDFLTASIWTGHVSPDNVVAAMGGNEPQFKSYTLITNNFGEFVNANGVLATVSFNATAAMVGDYALHVIGTKDTASDSRFVAGDGTNLPGTFTSGMLTVVDPGDFTRDNQVNAADIPAMMAALADLSAYKASHSLDDAGLVAIGDLDGDHKTTNADLQSLLTLLKSGGGSLAAVPEPPGWLLMAVFIASVLIAGIASPSKASTRPSGA